MRWIAIACMLVVANVYICFSQETVFTGFKNSLKRADLLFSNNDFLGAVALYKDLEKNGKRNKEIHLKIAQSYYQLNDFVNACTWFERAQGVEPISNKNILLYAQSLCNVGDYQNAIVWYKHFLEKEPDQEWVANKVWRLTNINFLYEDSIYYDVRPISFNSLSGDLCPVYYEKSLVFMSNRQRIAPLVFEDSRTRKPFYKLYQTFFEDDSLSSLSDSSSFSFSSPKIFCPELNNKYHIGPAAYYNHYKSMVYSESRDDNSGQHDSQIKFASKTDKNWTADGEYPYNSVDYSLVQPAVSNNGNILYFVSDMKGGYGGKDIYKSECIDGEWSKPENMGEKINTQGDEVFPYLKDDKTLYFSSNGHPGLGGLDLFRVEMSEEGYKEVHNLGYPINTRYDDFGITLNENGDHGYFSSNRKNGLWDDDIYDVRIKLQTYPIIITGTVSYKLNNSQEYKELKNMPGVMILVFDNIKEVVVSQAKTDTSGNFSIKIPYYSQYKVKVVGSDGIEFAVSLDIPKYVTTNKNYDIVVVKDDFEPNKNE